MSLRAEIFWDLQVAGGSLKTAPMKSSVKMFANIIFNDIKSSKIKYIMQQVMLHYVNYPRRIYRAGDQGLLGQI